MARGYRTEYLREQLIKILVDADIGMSGVDIAERLNVNRSTMTKYLKIFAAEGLLHQKNIGNIILWSLEYGQESYDFPADYFKVAPQFLDHLIKYSQNDVYSLIRNCLHSGASVERLVAEIIVPAIHSVDNLFDSAKIGNSERQFLQNVISNSLHIINQIPVELEPRKCIIIISADRQNHLISEAAASVLRFRNWSVFHLGDMSSSINVLFDLDLQKLLGRIPRQKSGITAILVFSDSEEGLNFFSDSVKAIKQKSRRSIKLILHGSIPKTKIVSDYFSTEFDDIIKWSKTISSNLEL